MSNLFIDQGNARGRNYGFLYILGLLVVAGVTSMVGFLPLVIYLNLKVDAEAFKSGYFDMSLFTRTSEIIQDRNLETAFALTGSLLIILSIYWYVTRIHRRPFKSIVTIYDKFLWRKFFYSFIIGFVSFLLIETINKIRFPEGYVYNFDLLPFLYTFILGTTLLLVSIIGEYILVKGYMVQFFGKYFKRSWVSYIFSLLFALIIMYFGFRGSSLPTELFINYTCLQVLLVLYIYLSNSVELGSGLSYGYSLNAFLFFNYYNNTSTPSESIHLLENVKYDWINVFLFIIILCVHYILMRKKYVLLPISTLLDKNRHVEIN